MREADQIADKVLTRKMARKVKALSDEKAKEILPILKRLDITMQDIAGQHLGEENAEAAE